jgi:hypothetical protein
VFGLQHPQAFYSMFGTPGGTVARDLALEAFHDDMTVTGRTVCERGKDDGCCALNGD